MYAEIFDASNAQTLGVSELDEHQNCEAKVYRSVKFLKVNIQLLI